MKPKAFRTSNLSANGVQGQDLALRAHCVCTACILRAQRLGYSPKNTCHLFTRGKTERCQYHRVGQVSIDTSGCTYNQQHRRRRTVRSCQSHKRELSTFGPFSAHCCHSAVKPARILCNPPQPSFNLYKPRPPLPCTSSCTPPIQYYSPPGVRPGVGLGRGSGASSSAAEAEGQGRHTVACRGTRGFCRRCSSTVWKYALVKREARA